MSDKNRTRRQPKPPTEGWDLNNCMVWVLALAAGTIGAIYGAARVLL